MPDTLKPCPFCGGKGSLGYRENEKSGDERSYFVSCVSCCANVPWYCAHYDVSKAEAIAAWNRRPSPSPEVERLVEALDTIHHALHIDHDPAMALLVVRNAIQEHSVFAKHEEGKP